MWWEGILALGLAVVILVPMLRPLIVPSRRMRDVVDEADPEETRAGQAVIALRDIEFDRETGKLSDEDYADLKARYTAEGVAALRAARPASADAVSVLVRSRVSAQQRGQAPPDCPRCGPRLESGAEFCSHCGDRLPTGRHCAACHAPLRHDGIFCEFCGGEAVTVSA